LVKIKEHPNWLFGASLYVDVNDTQQNQWPFVEACWVFTINPQGDFK